MVTSVANRQAGPEGREGTAMAKFSVTEIIEGEEQAELLWLNAGSALKAASVVASLLAQYGDDGVCGEEPFTVRLREIRVVVNDDAAIAAEATNDTCKQCGYRCGYHN
jgi:hypothetical protein